jgi:hypothetical protein
MGKVNVQVHYTFVTQNMGYFRRRQELKAKFETVLVQACFSRVMDQPTKGLAKAGHRQQISQCKNHCVQI